MPDITAYLMGDPSARTIRQPTEEERGRSPHHLYRPKIMYRARSPYSMEAEALEVGQSMDVPDYTRGNYCQQRLVKLGRRASCHKVGDIYRVTRLS